MSVLLYFLVFFSPFVVSAFSSIPQNRIPSAGWEEYPWIDPYDNWETIDVTTSGITPNGPNSIHTTLTELINSITTQTILFFPSGEYIIDQLVEFGQDNSNIILKGNGMYETKFISESNNGVFQVEGGWSVGKTVVSNVEPGSFIVELNNVDGYNVGDVIRVVEDFNDYQYLESWGRRGNGVIGRIDAINGNFVTLDVPFELGLDDIVTKTADTSGFYATKNVGFQDFGIFHSDDSVFGSSTFQFLQAYNCFIKNVYVENTTRHHVDIGKSNRISISGCYFYEAKSKGGGGAGYGVSVTFANHIYVYDNIFKNLRHPLSTQVGASYNVYAYNLVIEDVRDYCIENILNSTHPAYKWCKNSTWIRFKSINGIANAENTPQCVAHGNYPHSHLWEGNVLYSGICDTSHGINGPQFFFRNFLKGQPQRFGYWLEGVGIGFMGANDNMTAIGNFLINNATVELVEIGGVLAKNCIIGANFMKGILELGDMNEDFSIPDSLYLTSRPSFWEDGLNWPPFAPSSDSENNLIPAQCRYYNLDCSSSSNQDGNGNSAVVVGIVVGILCLIFLCILFVVIFLILGFFLYKRKRGENYEKNELNDVQK